MSTPQHETTTQHTTERYNPDEKTERRARVAIEKYETASGLRYDVRRGRGLTWTERYIEWTWYGREPHAQAKALKVDESCVQSIRTWLAAHGCPKQRSSAQVAYESDCRARTWMRLFGADLPRGRGVGLSPTERYIECSTGTHGVKQQCAVLGVNNEIVKRIRKDLRMLGILHRARSVFSREIKMQALRLYDQGLTGGAIGDALSGEGETWHEHRLYQWRKERPDTKRVQTYSMRDVMQMLGVTDHKTITRWIREEWLVDRVVGKQCKTSQRGWDKSDIYACLRHKETWIRVSPQFIRDEDMRHWLRQQQRDSGGKWYTIRMLARELHLSHETLRGWHIPWNESMVWGGQWIWLSHHDAQELTWVCLAAKRANKKHAIMEWVEHQRRRNGYTSTNDKTTL